MRTENNSDPGMESGYDNDTLGTDTETGQCGTISGDWWHPDNDGKEQSWTDNNGGRHTFTVDPDRGW